MKKLFVLMMALIMSLTSYAVEIETPADTTIDLSEVTVSSLYRNSVNVGYLVNNQTLISENYGQEPSNLFASMPNIFALNDNGTNFGYGYFRIRGLDQTRINATLDGMPWNEAEDYGIYFANSPDLMSSLHSIKVERGTSSTNNGIASGGGNINMESVDLLNDTVSYAYVGGGSFNTYKTSIIYNSGLFSDHHALHVKATQQQTDGYKDYGFNNSQAFTLKYGYFFNERHSLDILSLNSRHRNGQGWIGNTREELANNHHANGNLKTEDDEWMQSINKIQYKGKFANGVFLTASAYLQYQNGWYNFDLDNYMVKMVYDPNGDDTPWAPTGMLYSYGLKHCLYGGNAATKIYLNDLAITVGSNIYHYQREHFMDDRLDKHFQNIDRSEYYDNTGYKLDVNGYIALNYTLNNFNLSTNAQYRYVNFQYEDELDNLQNFKYDDFGTYWNFINYGLCAEYNINNVQKIYSRYAVTNREPTRSDMFGGNEYFLGNITTNKTERLYDIEVGYEVNTNKVKANINLYYMRFINERVLNGEYGINGLPKHDTANKSYRTGVEGNVEWNVWNNFYYTSAISFSHNKINSSTFTDKMHILTPSFTFNNDLYYKNSNSKVGINNQYHSEMYVDQANNHKIPDYLTFNAYGSYRHKQIEFGVHVNNIFNKVNYINAAEGADGLLWFRNAGANSYFDVKYYF